MSTKGIFILFSVAFLLYTVAPTILIIVNDTPDVSILFSSEEEEKEEKHLDIEVLFSITQTNNSDLTNTFSEMRLDYFDKKYTKPNLNIISPPPDIPVL